MAHRPLFVMFGAAHLAMLALAVVVPAGLVLAVRRTPRLDRPVRYALAGLLGIGWLAWLALFAARGWLRLGNALPLNLCDWAALALILALLKPGQRAYELGYFWGLGGTLQGLLTPDIAYGFPDPQFVFFAVNHAGIIAALLYLTLAPRPGGPRLRPVPGSIPRVVAATLAYAAVASAADILLGTNYGFLRAKPANASLFDFLSPWPWYVPELVGLGLLSVLVYYAPFALADRIKPYRQQGRASPSRMT